MAHTVLKWIQKAMAEIIEMEFYLKYTDYESIRKSICDIANYRDYYTDEDACIFAKKGALRGWIHMKANNSLVTAHSHPLLPISLKKVILLKMAKVRLLDWSIDNDWDDRVIEEASHIVNPILKQKCIRLADLIPINFETWFGDTMRECAALIKARDSVEACIPLNPRGISIRCIASNTLRLGLASTRIIQVVKDACADYLERIPNNVPVTFIDTVDQMYKRWDITLPELRCIDGKWKCNTCNTCENYKTRTAQGVWNHSQCAHHAKSVSDVNAVLDHVHAPVESDVFDEFIVRALRKHTAARMIQSRWRTAISNPLYTVCRNRLLTECNEFII